MANSRLNEAQEVEKREAEMPQLLLLRHLAGEKDAFPCLVGLYQARVYSYLARTGVAASFRDDLFQEIFFKVHRSAKTYDSSLPLTPWIFAITANAVRSHFRKQKVRRLSIFETKQEGQAYHLADDVSNEVAANETARWLQGRIAALPLHQREVLVLSVVSGMEQEEIATVLSIPLNTVKTQLRRARLKLAEDLKRRNLQSQRESL